MANFFEDNKSLSFQLDHPLMQRIVELKEKGFTSDRDSAYAPQDYADALENYRQVLLWARYVPMYLRPMQSV